MRETCITAGIDVLMCVMESTGKTPAVHDATLPPQPSRVWPEKVTDAPDRHMADWAGDVEPNVIFLYPAAVRRSMLAHPAGSALAHPAGSAVDASKRSGERSGTSPERPVIPFPVTRASK